MAAVPGFTGAGAWARGTTRSAPKCDGATPKLCDNGKGTAFCVPSTTTCCYYEDKVVGCRQCYTCGSSQVPCVGGGGECRFDHPILGPEVRCYDPKTQCCTPRGVQPKTEDFSARICKETLTPRPKSEKYKPTKNGCGSKDFDVADTWPAKGKGTKANFTPACNKHDVCYGTCKKDKDACDKAFCVDLLKACKNTWPKAADSKRREGCEGRADLYCAGVVLAGDSAYWKAQEEACHCCK